MVEPQRNFSPNRSTNATPTAASESLRLQEGSGKHIFSGLSGHSGEDSNFYSPMPGDAPSRTTPVRDPRRRQSHPPPPHRSPGFRQPQNPPTQGYAQPRPLAHIPEGQHPAGPFVVPGLHYLPTSPYPPASGYYGQYTVPNRPSLGETPPSYSYPHGYHPQGNVDSNLGRPEMQSNLQSMGQPHHPQYPYQHHSQEDQSSSSSMLSTTSPSRFASHPPSSHSPPYLGSGHFPAMAYPSPMGNPQYTYPSHFPATPPIYPPYRPMSYPQHAASPDEGQQGTWYFLTHGTPAPPQHYHYDGGQYHPYTTQYAPRLSHSAFPGSAVADSPSDFHSSTASTGRAASESAPPTSVISSTATPATDAATRSSVARPQSAGSKPMPRREWHPKPPPHRSPWVMWVGNVPADATHDELWEFFSTSPGEDDSLGDASVFGDAVVSIFLIARSNCAFINYSSESNLEAAIQTFHGRRLRPNDPQCPMLVCKVRRSADDLKSGVGGQRGTGMHRQWVKEQRKLQHSQSGSLTDASQSDSASVSSQSVQELVDEFDSVSLDPDQLRTRRTKQSSGSGSYTSTSSSLLGEHFPTRYFILKSLGERDLEISVQNGLWATQKHNELVLDRAYRTSRDVFLIFSVNKSGEFYGYARMAGPIRQGEGRVSWSSSSQTSPPPPSSSARLPSLAERRLLSDAPMFLSPDTIQQSKDAKPGMSSGCPPTILHAQKTADLRQDLLRTDSRPHADTAPPRLGGPEAQVDHSPDLKYSLDHHELRHRTMATQGGFHLDPIAPFRAMKDPVVGIEALVDDDAAQSELHDPAPAQASSGDGANDMDRASPTWGDCFRVEWLELRKVPFHKTRHLRNAWNKGREIKVSRDGTELESSVGKRFLEEWANLVES